MCSFFLYLVKVTQTKFISMFNLKIFISILSNDLRFSDLHDIEYQSSVDMVSASWHGFVDLDAGVHSYYWCVGLTDAISECGVKPWVKVGLRTSAISNVTSPLSHGILM